MLFRSGLWNHAPEQVAQHVLAHEFLIVAHGDKLDRVSMNSSLIVRTLLDETGMNAQVAWQLRCWHYRIICDDNIAGAIVQDADDRTILHRPASQVAHALACSLAEEVAALQCISPPLYNEA